VSEHEDERAPGAVNLGVDFVADCRVLLLSRLPEDDDD
jgi:hypothetical protein